MRYYLIIALGAIWFSASTHADDWSLSTFSHGPRSTVAYESSGIARRSAWRESHVRRARRHTYSKIAAPELRDDYREPRLYRASDDRPRRKGVKCEVPVRGLGTQWVGKDGALEAARKDWMERVRYDLGEAYLDMTHAGDEVSRCGRTSIGETLGQVMYRCEVVARPCKAPFGETEAAK